MPESPISKMCKGNKALVLFNRGGSSGAKRRISQKWIKLWSGLIENRRQDFCHGEIFFPHTGQSFSARGFDNNVNFKMVQYSHPERWFVIELKSYIKGTALYHSMYEDCHKYLGCKYDYVGAAFNKLNPHNNRWYCFEIINHIFGFEPCAQYGAKTVRNIIGKASGCYGLRYLLQLNLKNA